MKGTKNRFTKPTLYFSLVGFIAAAIPALFFIGVESCLEKLGYSCISAIPIICNCAAFICLLLPISFFVYLLRSHSSFSDSQIKGRILIFDSILFLCIPTALEPYVSTANTLCNVADGQNGLELVFSAWLALPVLLLFSFIFEQIFKGRQIAILNSDGFIAV